MTIEFGVFDHIEHLPGVGLEQLYDERLIALEMLDRYGFYGYHLAEHHTPAVHSMAPSQNVFLASVAQRTKRLRFGPCVYVLPLHHPLRLIEEISMLDNISHGRLEVGVGRGGVLEAYFWGQDSDPETNQARYEENLAVMLEGLSHEALTYHGRFWEFEQVPMRLRPKQTPYPPLWYMRNPETAALAGMNCMVVGGLDRFEANVVRYKRLWNQHQGEGALTAQGTEPKMGLVTHMVVADTDEEAQAAAKPAWDAYRWNLARPRRLEAERRKLTQFLERADSGDARQGSTPVRHLALEERHDLEATLQELSKEDRKERKEQRLNPGGLGAGAVAGSPDTVRQYMDEYSKCGANYFVCSFQWGNLSHEQACRSIELFAEEIMPAFTGARPDRA